MLSRLGLLWLVVLSTMPVLTFITSMGGVSPTEVVCATINTAAVALVLGLLAGVLALVYDKSALMASLMAVAYLLPSMAMGPALYILLGDLRERDMLDMSPLLAVASDQSIHVLLPALAFVAGDAAPLAAGGPAVSHPGAPGRRRRRGDGAAQSPTYGCSSASSRSLDCTPWSLWSAWWAWCTWETSACCGRSRFRAFFMWGYVAYLQWLGVGLWVWLCMRLAGPVSA